MIRRSRERTNKIRIAIRFLLEAERLTKGDQARLAEYFAVSRQRVHQIVVEERRRSARGPLPNDAGTMIVRLRQPP